jgi:hypothetical protein
MRKHYAFKHCHAGRNQIHPVWRLTVLQDEHYLHVLARNGAPEEPNINGHVLKYVASAAECDQR